MNKKNLNLFLMMLFVFVISDFSLIGSEESAGVTATDDIKPDCETIATTQNPLEQLLDELHENGAREHWVETPERRVPLIQVLKADGGISYIKFEVPDRFDLSDRYTEKIAAAVETRNELPFVAFRFVKNVFLDETVDIKLSEDWTLYNARITSAGKYGDLLCYNHRRNNKDQGQSCMTLSEFKECLKYYKPNNE